MVDYDWERVLRSFDYLIDSLSEIEVRAVQAGRFSFSAGYPRSFIISPNQQLDFKIKPNHYPDCEKCSRLIPCGGPFLEMHQLLDLVKKT